MTLLARMFSVLAACACLAAPAFAEAAKCQVVREADGMISQTEAVLAPQFSRLVVQQGPLFTDLVMDPASQLRPIGDYQGDAQIYLFWVGGGVADKAWREPGGVAYALGGFAFRWPDFTFPMGGRIDYVRATVRMGEAKIERDFFLYENNGSRTQGQTFKMHEAMENERPNFWDYRSIEPEHWPAWNKAFAAGGKLTLELQTGKRAPLASATFNLPPLAQFNVRAAEDIRDFRTRADPTQCASGAAP